MRLRILPVFFCLGLMLSSHSHAQQHISHCDMTDSTAAAQACLKKHLDEAQNRLNRVYEELSSALNPEDLQELKRLQQNWLNYKDEECNWESGRTQTASLQQVYELSCQARVTENRAEQLEITLADMEEPGVQRQFGTFPRWVNVVAKDYPDVFWRYGQRAGMDLDCDEVEEHVMTGVRLKPYKIQTQEEGDSELPALHTAEVVIVISENPAVGRPEASLFKYPVSLQPQEQTLCSADVMLSSFEKPAPEEDEDDSESKKECLTGLKIQSAGCTPIYLHWTGNNYGLWQTEKDKE